jgi:hypothetical protein
MKNNNTAPEKIAFDNPDLDATFRDYAWNYFSLHADQRMKAFHFYILLSSAIAGGLSILIKNGEIHKWMCLFGMLLIFFSFIFWKFDQRTSELIKLAEGALIFLDAQYELPSESGIPHPLELFSREKILTSKKKSYPLLSGHFSYSRSLRWVFFTISMIGIGIFITFLVA